jgi:hypothetical protein
MSIVASREAGYRRFFLQARPLTEAQAQRLEELLQDEPSKTAMAPLFEDERGRLIPVHILMRIPLLFCPRCGANLEKLAARQPEEFDKLAEAHARFADR